MNANEYCIIENVSIEEDELSINDVVKVFYKNKYIDKYTKLIDRNKLFPMDEANEILKNNSTFGFVITSRNAYSKGIDMIEELAFLEERAELNFEVLNWNSIEDYIKEIKEQGYISEKLTEEEFDKWKNRHNNEE